MKGLLTAVVKVTKVNEHTVRITTGPNPLLPNNLTEPLRHSRRSGAEANKVTLPPSSSKAGDETYAVRNANGTGPFRLAKREPDVRTELERNRDYWGKGTYPMEVAKVVFTPVRSATTRVAALLSGEIDFLMNQGATELRSSDVKGRNPFADKRVREAMNIAINREAVKRVVMRGRVGARRHRRAALHRRLRQGNGRGAGARRGARQGAARRGRDPDGFAVTLSCPNDRYVNDEAICQAATGMFGQIGVEARLDARPKSIHFAELPKGELDLYMLGWGVPTMEDQMMLPS